MRYLLDTHVFIWLVDQTHRVNGSVLEALGDSDNDVRLSVVSAWEIALKHATGKLRVEPDPQEFVPLHLARQGTTVQPIELRHVLAVASLPMHHRDPFDRLLVAQAQALGATLVTADRQLAAYDVTVLDPR